jgi:hypothetical protein
MCPHDGFHGIRTAYDRKREVLVYFWICERCGARLEEATRAPYRPAYDPQGADRYLNSNGLEHAQVPGRALTHTAVAGEEVDVPEYLRQREVGLSDGDVAP